MSLITYQQKRFFDLPPEPVRRRRGKRESGCLFFVKMHDATRLHYDFRLEYAGVLKSWVIPDGPCLDPDQEREAVPVNDHQVRYGDFEGLILPGYYGAGTVLQWDRGTWTTNQDVDQALRDGRLDFRLHGQKLKGSWSLVRDPTGEKSKNWSLRKAPDEEARSLLEVDIIEQQPTSVLTNLTLGEIEEICRRQPVRRGQRCVALDKRWIREANQPSAPSLAPATLAGLQPEQSAPI